MGGVGILLLLALLAALAPAIAPYDPLAIDLPNQLQRPNSEHLLGTDLLGRDGLSRLLYGGRATLVIALFAVSISLLLGALLGLLSGFYGGLVDTVIMRFTDMLLAFPRILLALCVVALLGVGLENVMIAVGIAGIAGYARVVRGSVFSAKEQLYVEAARVVGCNSPRILFRHVLPNVVAPVIVLATLDVAHAILAASSLSFLGLGVQPPTPEWGLMLNEGRNYLQVAPWITTVPGLTIMLTVLCVTMFGDGLRDALDPRLQIG
jgi:ABC-type dipeptide/oligopeptide/nickel transport system permease subunit